MQTLIPVSFEKMFPEFSQFAAVWLDSSIYSLTELDGLVKDYRMNVSPKDIEALFYEVLVLCRIEDKRAKEEVEEWVNIHFNSDEAYLYWLFAIKFTLRTYLE